MGPQTEKNNNPDVFGIIKSLYKGALSLFVGLAVAWGCYSAGNFFNIEKSKRFQAIDTNVRTAMAEFQNHNKQTQLLINKLYELKIKKVGLKTSKKYFKQQKKKFPTTYKSPITYRKKIEEERKRGGKKKKKKEGVLKKTFKKLKK